MWMKGTIIFKYEQRADDVENISLFAKMEQKKKFVKDWKVHVERKTVDRSKTWQQDFRPYLSETE